MDPVVDWLTDPEAQALFVRGDPDRGEPTGAQDGVSNEKIRAAPRFTAAIHGLSEGACQQTNTIRPPGRSARRKLANASTGSAKNITP